VVRARRENISSHIYDNNQQLKYSYISFR
jgi:hypothetical protein